ncbi:magnesium transporter CorA family protein [Sphingomonas glaciei]|uniref:Magnesium transporter CorA family protein n=1 Tax=Sphingomonas glaciei TaxID=2938948 RepID=A0ABY5MRD2_9SPHN|nr:magnesium transporter CorA family protein [Sphingomonas glaciei]UUR07048.1 magnesium transporter CorA family protein [Sphingomonas glaciei]
MLRAYGPDCDGSVITSTGEIPAGATWIDLEEPTREEEMLVEQSLGFSVPTRDDMVEIEPSSRLFERDGALVMTVSVLFGVQEGQPQSEPISFVLKEGKLVTVRYVTPKPWLAFSREARVELGLVKDSTTALTRLLDAIVDRLADELEAAGAEIEGLSRDTFRSNDYERISTKELEAVLRRIGQVQTLIAKIRITAVSTARALGFLAASDRLHGPGCERTRELISSLSTDVSALIDHSAFLSGQLTFLLDASLGLISIEQNAAMKLFSWMAVVFLPPTLIAGIFGMNFVHMPELDEVWGYPMSLGLMLVSAVLPLWILKRRGWI